jgi:hypothetical protein
MLPGRDLKPALHMVHDGAAVVRVEYEFAGQEGHRLLPVTSLYVPPTHATQAPPSGPVYPVLQVQFRSSALPMRAVFVYAGHAVHGCDPSQSLYVPTVHCEHGPPSGPVNPGTHEHTVLADSEDWLCAHGVQASTPASGLNLPAAHS